MLIRMMSDLHLEFEKYDKNGNIMFPDDYFKIEPLPTDSETVLVLAGDISLVAIPSKLIPFLESIHDRFKRVIYVVGNHEHYGSEFHDTIKNLKKLVEELNVVILEKSSVIIDGVMFIGGTMWTDFNSGSPISMNEALNFMHDYKATKWHDRKMLPSDIYDEHVKFIQYIDISIQNVPTDMKKVIVTHHAPSFKSVNYKYYGETSNYFYASHLDETVIHRHKPVLWIHGHMHDACDYNIHQTRVICNPRGYVGTYDLNKQFDNLKLVEI